ncbi:hypothetical protein BBJ28_00026669 [Nothophytophthora sp. Chile5]|nr:hypothetical protein BBJ28_00026669 [Nothophytophthora sp. Chile5]
MQEGIQASHEYTQAALQAHCTSIEQLVQSNLREESAKFNAEVQVSGSKLRSHLEGYVDQIQAHQDTRMAALISAQLRADRNSIEDAWRAFTIDETDALERRIEERLRESRQQQEDHLAQMQESFQNHLREEKVRAESDGRTRTSINADTMMTHINERVKSEVRVEVESMTGRVEETIQNNLKAERERQNAQHAQEHDKRLKVAIERSIPLITIAANETVAKTVDERQSRFEKHIQQQIDAIRTTLSPTQTLNTPCVHDLRMAPLAWTEPSISMKDGAADAHSSAVIALRQDAARTATYTAVFEVSPQTLFVNVPCAE